MAQKSIECFAQTVKLPSHKSSRLLPDFKPEDSLQEITLLHRPANVGRFVTSTA